MAFQNDIDLLNPPAELEKKKHKLKYLVQTPNSFFMIYVCVGINFFFLGRWFLFGEGSMYGIHLMISTYLCLWFGDKTIVFSHSQIVVVCGNCQTILCQPIGSKARLTVMTR
ncbi:hypothetical protein ERO13_D10G094250v2 [Gossypium hirsutum]|uniref:40S ribosomal protein S27 n=1 Tax=Gossypium barbadense TaxID=3634 RepID=A0A5J5PNX7_GOSBA|nr:hypothetical protein ES319_D10G102500v1 [Gossypium barbadense]KAG4125415.1 hypothetical protein ERO13_D10G094250v2 [Gossypium hirsutum]